MSLSMPEAIKLAVSSNYTLVNDRYSHAQDRLLWNDMTCPAHP